MPIKSYLAYPIDGKKNALILALNALDNCEVIPSENEELLVVLTDTLTIEEDKSLKDTIDALDSLKMALRLVSMTSLHSSSFIRIIRLSLVIPALLTNTAGGP